MPHEILAVQGLRGQVIRYDNAQRRCYRSVRTRRLILYTQRKVNVSTVALGLLRGHIPYKFWAPLPELAPGSVGDPPHALFL